MNNIASLVRRLFLFLSVAILPIILWFYRNYTISSTLTGYRTASARTWIQSSYDMMNVLSLWFLPPSVLFRYRVYLMILLILLFSGIVFLVVGRKIALANIRETLPFLLFTCMYTAFMIYTTAKTALSPIDDRYLSPIFVPLILSVFYLMDSLLYHFRIKTGSTFPRAILAASLAIWLIYPIATTYRTVKVSLEEGAGGFHSTDWAESDLISYLRHNELPGTIYTNEPSAVYALTGQVYNPSPEKFAYESQVSTDDLLRFQADVQRRGVIYIVWFHTDWWKGYLYDVDDLNKICALERIVTRKDGDVYRVRASHCLPPA